MKIEQIDLDREVLIVAEIGNNHEGSVKAAEEMIWRAAEAGAQAVKFQTFKTEAFVSRSDGVRFQRLKAFELSEDDFAALADCARQAKLLFLSTPLDLRSAAFLDGQVDAFKIASGDNNFYPLIDQIARTGKPVVLSTGLADMDQVAYIVARIRRLWLEQAVDPGLAVLHCVASYPVPPEQANIAAVAALKERLDCTIGYSDHTVGIDAALVAVALGARVVEKHFTLDKNFSDFRDHQLSADPAELAELVRQTRAVETLLGDGAKRLMGCEKEAEPLIRRSIAAGRDLEPGAVLSLGDLIWIRPGHGLAPGREAEVLGRSLARPVRQGELIQPEMLSG